MPRVSHGQLTATTVKTVGIDAYTTQITILNRSQTGEIYFTVDGSIPTVGGEGCYVCIGSTTVPTIDINTMVTVRLISTTALYYSVVGESQ